MIVKKENFNVPIATGILGVLFCAVYLFKLGEAYFYDYPAYYIYLTIPDVINISLKVVLLYSIVIALYVAFLTWEWASVSFFYGMVMCGLIKAYGMAQLYKSGLGSVLGYINTGTTALLLVSLGFFLSKSFVKGEVLIILKPRFAISAFLTFLALNFFIGLNYHSFFPNSTWQKDDGKVLIGTYKDSFLFRDCVNGKSYFYLEDVKGQKLEMFKINTSGVLTLRCFPINNKPVLNKAEAGLNF